MVDSSLFFRTKPEAYILIIRPKIIIILASSNSLSINCGSILKEALSSVGGSGGGKELYAQGACSVNDISLVLSKIKELIV